MYAYLNDLSMHLPAGQTKATWSLLSEVIDISSRLKNDYAIELVKVPDNFKSTKIANSYSIDELLALAEEEFDLSNKQLIYDFLANRTLSKLDEVEAEILKEINNKNAWIEVKYSTTYSQLLTGAYLLQMPAISFQTTNALQVDRLPCEYTIEYADKTKSKNVDVVNLYQAAQINNHHPFLVRIKSDIVFGKGKWNPYTKPIWNDKTKPLIAEMEFPQSIEGKKDKISELIEVGEKIALLNCWRFDNEITKINSNKGQIRMVFISESNLRNAYLSIDMKNPYGRFEHHDDRGRHLGEIDFATGTYIPRGNSKTGKDDKGHHDLKFKK